MSSLDLDFQAGRAGPSKKIAQPPNSSAKASINLDPTAFFEVAVEKKHCYDMAKGCGLSMEVVEQALKEDNDERREAIQVEVELLEAAEKENHDEPRVNLDSDSDEEISAAEEDC